MVAISVFPHQNPFDTFTIIHNESFKSIQVLYTSLTFEFWIVNNYPKNNPQFISPPQANEIYFDSPIVTTIVYQAFIELVFRAFEEGASLTFISRSILSSKIAPPDLVHCSYSSWRRALYPPGCGGTLEYHSTGFKTCDMVGAACEVKDAYIPGHLTSLLSPSLQSVFSFFRACSFGLLCP